jgi:hypothetical protein
MRNQPGIAAKISDVTGTKPALRNYLFKCSNLERGESMKDPVSIFGCWRGFQFAGSARRPTPGRFQLPISALLARIRKLIPEHNDRHYDEIVRGFGVGALQTPATPMSDQELSKAIADFLRDSPSAEAVSRDDLIPHQGFYRAGADAPVRGP